MNRKLILAIVIFVVLFGLGIYFVSGKSGPSSSTKLDGFAQCLKDNGATFYGAFWCPHCQNTKDEFGASEKLLPYVECSTPDGQGQLDVCKEKDIKSYPTWEFSDGTRLEGEVPLSTLAEKTSCSLPE